MPEAPRSASAAPSPDDRGEDRLRDRIQAAAGGLEALLTTAETVQRERAETARERGAPRWTDVFTTQFTEFSNRPR